MTCDVMPRLGYNNLIIPRQLQKYSEKALQSTVKLSQLGQFKESALPFARDNVVGN